MIKLFRLAVYYLRLYHSRQPKMSREFSAAVTDTHITLCRTMSGERYIFIYRTGQEPELFQAIGRYAASPDHRGFTWLDAAHMSDRLAAEICGGK